jgi:hypothetical protein
MAKIGRNSPCPCGSGKKYKHCCEKKEAEMRQRELPSGHFRYESGSYGSPGRGYMPSILCYQQLGPDLWTEYFCLVKPDAILEDEDAAAAIAEKHVEGAHAARADGGSPQDFALSLRHEGYKSVSDFRVVRSEGKGEV